MPEITGGGSEIGGVLPGITLTDAEKVAAGSTVVKEGHATAAEVATAIEAEADVSWLARELNAYPNIAETASIFGHANLTVAKGASIFDSTKIIADRAAAICDALATAKAASIFEHVNLTVGRAASICDEAAFTAANAASMLTHANLTAPKAASILNDAGLDLAKAVSIFQHSNLSVSKANAICDHANLLSDREQAILYQFITDDDFARLLDILTYGAADTTIASDTAISDKNFYHSLTVNNGVTLTVNTVADEDSGVIMTGTLTNNGTIHRTAQGAAGGAAGQPGCGAGVKGGGGLLIVVKTLDNNNTIRAPGLAGNSGTLMDGLGNGGNGTAGALYRVGSDTVGAGGAGGAAGEDGAGGGSDGGAGGDGTGVDGGNGGAASYTTKTGAEIHAELLQAMVDYFIETVEGKAAPSAPQTFPDIFASGSGGGGGTNGHGACGGGGGGSGEIIVACDTYDNTGGTISADAGVGGNGGTEGSEDCGGGGGGGGFIYMLYKTQTAVGTLSMAGGNGGTGDANGENGAAPIVGETAIDVTA